MAPGSAHKTARRTARSSAPATARSTVDGRAPTRAQQTVLTKEPTKEPTKAPTREPGRVRRWAAARARPSGAAYEWSESQSLRSASRSPAAARDRGRQKRTRTNARRRGQGDLGRERRRERRPRPGWLERRRVGRRKGRGPLGRRPRGRSAEAEVRRRRRRRIARRPRRGHRRPISPPADGAGADEAALVGVGDGVDARERLCAALGREHAEELGADGARGERVGPVPGERHGARGRERRLPARAPLRERERRVGGPLLDGDRARVPVVEPGLRPRRDAERDERVARADDLGLGVEDCAGVTGV